VVDRGAYFTEEFSHRGASPSITNLDWAHRMDETSGLQGFTLNDGHCILAFTIRQILFHSRKMRVLRTFLLQVGLACSNLRVAEIPCFAGPDKGAAKAGASF
jgi:hypothetical protein